GGDDDTPNSGRQILHFVRSTGISFNLFILHDLQTRTDGELLIPLHRRFDTHYRRAHPSYLRHWDYLTGNFVTYFPKRMKPSTLQQTISDTYHQACSHQQVWRRMASNNLFNATFGVAHAYALRRMSDAVDAVLENGYMDYLCHIEAGLYDEQEVLREDCVAALKGLPLPPPMDEHLELKRYTTLTALAMLPGMARVAWRRHHTR
ncbi:MAG: hypothetical protein QHJ73_19700, partial [Armatimonadota bacterium]|nr:hypothetical protein [Armatimonadota bacterium]